jgi:hypothetical protein
VAARRIARASRSGVVRAHSRRYGRQLDSVSPAHAPRIDGLSAPASKRSVRVRAGWGTAVVAAVVVRDQQGGSSKSGHWSRLGHSRRAAHSSQWRTSWLRSIRAVICGSFRSATSRSRSIASPSSGDADSSSLISSSARPARWPVSITARVRTVWWW